MIKEIGVILMIGSVVLPSCVKEATIESDDCDETVSFQDEILPEIFNTSCNSVVGCHSSEDVAGGYVWETYDQIVPSADLIAATIKRESGV